MSHDECKVRGKELASFCVSIYTMVRDRCVLLIVPDNLQYNSSAVVIVRQLATISKHNNIHFGIVDASKQSKFLSNFNTIPDVSCLPYYPVSCSCFSGMIC